MRKIILVLLITSLFAACNGSDPAKEPIADSSSASSSADSIKNAVENSLKDSVLYPTDSVKVKDTLRK